ncbi:MAG: carbohydrate ABC transporter permease [Lachnospirales bacterium]
MQGKESKSDKIFLFFIYLTCAIMIFIVAYPLYFVLIASFSSPEAVVTGEVVWRPIGFNFESYKLILDESKIWIGYKNTIIYTVVGTILNVFLTTLAAYPLSRKNMPCRTLFTFIIAFTMLFSGGMIPIYLVVKSLGLTDTIWAMVIPNAIATYNLLVMKSYFQNSIPEELIEAGEIDGCNEFRTLKDVVLPLSKPIMAVILLFYAVGHWNAYFNALIYLREQSLYPLQVILREILLQNDISAAGGLDTTGMYEKMMQGESMKYSIILISSLPVMLLYPLVQKHFVKGVMVGAIKG